MMKWITLSVVAFLAFAMAANSNAEEAHPNFDYGPGETLFNWGTEIPQAENTKSDLRIRVGTRLQSLVEDKSSAGVHTQDFFVRRARLQVEADFLDDLSVYMDIRADRVDAGTSGKNAFELGDAFFQKDNLFGNPNLNLRLFRAKYDVSRVETISSSRIIIPNRPTLADYAADYISKARRGSNIQINGDWNNRVQGQIVVGDSVTQPSFEDALGEASATLNMQNLAVGARIRISPFTHWEDAGLTETFFGKGQHFTLGAGYFRTGNIQFTASNQTLDIDRELSNFEMSFHYGSFSIATDRKSVV